MVSFGPPVWPLPVRGNRTRIATETVVLLVALGMALHPLPASAQVLLTPGQLDQLVSRIALYPDPLPAQVPTASTVFRADCGCGPRIALGTAFAPWGWDRSGFGWATRAALLDGRPWERTGENHETCTHP